MDIGFHHRGVHSHLAAFDNLLFRGDLNRALMQLGDRLRTQLARQPPHRFIVGNLATTDAREVPIDEIGSHFTAHGFKAPTADMLQQQHSQGDFSRGARASAGLAFLVALAQLLLNDLE